MAKPASTKTFWCPRCQCAHVLGAHRKGAPKTARIAQRVERHIRNAEAEGSSPSSGPNLVLPSKLTEMRKHTDEVISWIKDGEKVTTHVDSPVEELREPSDDEKRMVQAGFDMISTSKPETASEVLARVAELEAQLAARRKRKAEAQKRFRAAQKAKEGT